MRCDDGTESADDRDESAVNGIFAAGMILHRQLARIDSGRAVRHVEAALEQLDGALREIRWAAFVRQRDTRAQADADPRGRRRLAGHSPADRSSSSSVWLSVVGHDGPSSNVSVVRPTPSRGSGGRRVGPDRRRP
jgi:hypothetical protein